MKKYILIFVASLLLFSCDKPSKFSKNFKCNSKFAGDLENVKDFKNLFTIQLPKNWKTNLFYDALQSSIYTADTTKQLTETILLDITYINKNVTFNDTFKLQQEQESLGKNLIKTEAKEIILLEKPSYYMLSKGKKGKYSYQICQVYVKINEDNFILVKAEIYGNSSVNSRMCNAISFIDKIKITHQND